MKISLRIIIGIIPFLWTACVIPVNNHKVPNFYLLLSKPDDAYKSNSNGEISFYIEEVRLAQYLQDERLIARPEDEIIEFRENERWGEPLELGIGRVVGQNLSDLLGTLNYGFFPQRKKFDFKNEVEITVERFERVSTNKVYIKAFWEIQSEKSGVQRHVFDQEIPLTNGGVREEIRALSLALTQLTIQIADKFQ